jgi:protein SCO1
MEVGMKSRLFFCLLATLLAASCNRPESAKDKAGGAGDTKRYHLTGRVISIDKRGNSVMIDGDEIPGFMSAMQMPYTVKDFAILDKLNPGDQITADVVVHNDESWLENVAVTGHQAAPKPSTLQMPAPNEAVPDFQLVNQDGKRISLSQYRGKALLVTFIYTRCPFPDFCPRVTGEFAEINRQLQSNPALYRQTHLLSISFDPQHDTPKALREYAYSNAGSKQPALFEHWEFAVVPAAQLHDIATFFGVSIEIPDNGGAITHSLSTAVIAPDGRMFKWYPGSDWLPADLIKDAAAATHTTG